MRQATPLSEVHSCGILVIASHPNPTLALKRINSKQFSSFQDISETSLLPERFRYLSTLPHLEEELANVLPLVPLELDDFTVFRMLNHGTITSKFLERDSQIVKKPVYVMVLLSTSSQQNSVTEAA